MSATATAAPGRTGAVGGAPRSLRPARAGGAGAPWWLHPSSVVLLVVPVTLLVATVLTDVDYRTQFREPKHLTTATAQLVLVAALVLAGVAAVAAVPGRRAPAVRIDDPALGETLRRCASALFWVTVLGYAAFVASGVAHGASLGSIVSSLTSQDNYSGTFKEQFATIPGLTTLTQVGIAFEVVALYAHRHRPDARLVVQIVVVYVLATLRAFLNTERLALIELAAPLVAVLAVSAVRRGGAVRGAVVRFLPVLFLPVLLLVFAGFEYSRSWQYFKTRTHLGFWEFMLLRLGGYYATSYNNGQVLLDHGRWPGRLPYDSIQAFWTAPGIGTLDLYDRFSAPAPAYASDLLTKFASPEFNNPGGLTDPFVDFGTSGGFVFFVVAGIAVGLLYRGMRDGGALGSLLYPVALTGLSDLPRELYWTLGRVVPAVVALLVVALALHRQHRRRTRRVWRRPRRPADAARHPGRAQGGGWEHGAPAGAAREQAVLGVSAGEAPWQARPGASARADAP